MRIRNRVTTVAAAVLALAPLLGAPPAQAQVEGTNYAVLSPAQPTQNPGKIEVLEFFSYACPHCAEFYPLVSTWLAMQPKDVAFRRVPVGFERPPWINLQRAYFALLASGDFDRLDGPLFAAIHQEHLLLFDESALADWVGKKGGNAEKFAAAYVSFGINNQTVQADKMVEDYHVTGVPTLVVDGKYVALGNTLSELLANTDLLIAKVRAEHAAAAPAKKK
ncbi:MAG TPA: thiol:disulfide interchange protein DsbA/DsbL [Steroidobacteraceae bacterium]|nr:thiol:disulfide interchange protein DsbA/DsbL [Steroidobacteraceae bacterium]